MPILLPLLLLPLLLFFPRLAAVHDGHVATATSGPGVATPARFPEDFDCNEWSFIITQNERQVWLVLFKKTYCPHCQSMDWDWQMSIADLKAAPHVRVAEVQMNRCPALASAFSVDHAPTVLTINGKHSELYTGARSTQGFVGAVQRSIAKWKLPMSYVDRSRPVHMLSSTTIDPVLETNNLPWVLQVSARWPPSPSLLDPRLASLGVRSAFAAHSDTKLMSLLSLKHLKPGFYWLPPKMNLLLDSEAATQEFSPTGFDLAPAATVDAAAAFESPPCREFEVNVRMLNVRRSPSLHGEIIGQWTARTLFLGTCASDTSVDSSCPWLMTCANSTSTDDAAPSFVTRVGEDGSSIRIRPSSLREKQEIALTPTRRLRLADQVVEWAQLALSYDHVVGDWR